MKQLDALSEQILSRIKQSGEDRIAKHEVELAKKLEDSRLHLVEQQKQRKHNILLASEADYDRQLQSLQNKKRNGILREKQMILESVYQAVIDKMSAWDDETFQQFTESILKHFEGVDFKLTIGEQSRAYFTEKFKVHLKNGYSQMTISEETVPNKAGFIVEIDGIDYNFFFEQLIMEIKKEFSPELASLAFEKNE